VTVTLANLLVRTTKTALYETALSIASSLGLPVSSWQAGDPTRSLYHVEAELFEKLEEWAVGAISAHFLEEADGEWLKYGAKQRFNVDVPDATYATTDVTLTNASGYVYELAAGDLTFKNTDTGKTYHNTTGGSLAARVGIVNGTLDVTVVADDAGSDSTAAVGDIDALVTALSGVTCANAVAAVGVDEQDPATTVAQCLAKLDAISTMKGAYDYVARNPLLAGTSACTRVRTYTSTTDTGDVTVYCAGPAGGVTEADRILIEAGIVKYATPLCITPTVLAAANVTVPVTYTKHIYASSNKTAAEVAADDSDALLALFAGLDIGGDIIPPSDTGSVYQSLILSTILSAHPESIRVVMTLPAGDTALTNGQVAALGTVTATIVIVVDP